MSSASRRLVALVRAPAAILLATLRRMRAAAWLTGVAMLAMVVASAVTVTVPLYAEAAGLRVMRAEIARQEEQAGRSPFALLFRYIGSWNAPLEWERVEPADRLLDAAGVRALELPVQTLGRSMRTGQMRMFGEGGIYGTEFVSSVTVGFLSGLDPQVDVFDGASPRPAAALTAPVEVMITRGFADRYGINLGDRFRVVAPGRSPAAFSVEVVGIWRARNAADPAWFLKLDSFDDVLLVHEASFTGPLAAALTGEVDQAVWFVRLNGDSLTAASVDGLLGRLTGLSARASSLVPGLRLEQSPQEALDRYRGEAGALATQLFIFSAPVIGLILYFVGMIADVLVQRRRGEIALLKSRGIASSRIVAMYLVEWSLLGGAALWLGPPLGVWFATLLGQVRSFLVLGAERDDLLVALSWSSQQWAVLAIVVTIAVGLLPVWRATRRTLADEQRDAARVRTNPLWPVWLVLELVLLALATYGWYQLQQTGGLQLGGADPLANPLLLFVPVLACLAGGLLSLRLMPWLFELLARLATLPGWIAPMLALRNLSRQPDAYRGPLLLLVLTLGLSAYTASMAATMDDALALAARYQVGAAAQLFETGERPTAPTRPGQPGQPPTDAADDGPRFVFVPVQEHLDVPGITAVTRVGSYQGNALGGGSRQRIQVIGIDRSQFPTVNPLFQPAWADGQPLGALMNQLGATPSAALVSRDLLGAGLKVGDTLPLLVTMFGEQQQINVRVSAALDLWPGLYPQDGPFVITNLDYLFDSMGSRFPYDVWIDRDERVPIAEIEAGVRARGFSLVGVLDRAGIIAAEQARPQRQGLFGLLSIGFITCGVLTIVGFLVTGAVSARRRSIEFGMLRAMGFGGGGVLVALALEQVLLVLLGLGVGTAIGLLVATVIVPLLQVGVGPHPGTPATPARVAWQEIQLIYVVFGATLTVTLGVLALNAARLRIFQAVKLGDAN
ncbi:MAG: ABC transporter permease [Chloroflexi bacterium]|nr:ABC transporter permease [Chloroflexota bacterium]